MIIYFFYSRRWWTKLWCPGGQSLHKFVWEKRGRSQSALGQGSLRAHHPGSTQYWSGQYLYVGLNHNGIQILTMSLCLRLIPLLCIEIWFYLLICLDFTSTDLEYEIFNNNGNNVQTSLNTNLYVEGKHEVLCGWLLPYWWHCYQLGGGQGYM